MNEMIERVAKAICRTQHSRFSDFTVPEMDGIVERYWHGHIDTAKAAIEAMREPTKAMCDAYDARYDYLVCADGLRSEDAWEVMIDEALKPADGTEPIDPTAQLT